MSNIKVKYEPVHYVGMFSIRQTKTEPVKLLTLFKVWE